MREVCILPLRWTLPYRGVSSVSERSLLPLLSPRPLAVRRLSKQQSAQLPSLLISFEGMLTSLLNRTASHPRSQPFPSLSSPPTRARMATLLPSPTSSSSPPSNPYTRYILSISSAFPSPTSPSARTGVKARLILLFCALALLFFSSCGTLAVHSFSKRLRGRRWWVWKWVEREGGRCVFCSPFSLLFEGRRRRS